jgi:hypothetical protein
MREQRWLLRTMHKRQSRVEGNVVAPSIGCGSQCVVKVVLWPIAPLQMVDLVRQCRLADPRQPMKK